MKLGLFSCAIAIGITTVVTPALAQAPWPEPLPSPSHSTAPPPSSQPQPPPPQPSAPSPPPASSVKMTLEATQQADRPVNQPPRERSPDDYILLHGFRLGYGYVMNYDEPAAAFKGKSLKEQADLRSPHHFLLGYEVVYRVIGHSWLNVLLLGNAMVAGLEQSKILPSANLMIGFEIKNSFQMGVGANLSPLKGSEAHTVAAAGWTPRVGSIYTPVHIYFIPDVDGNHRMGVTTGVTF